jgi:hypothetical protein
VRRGQLSVLIFIFQKWAVSREHYIYAHSQKRYCVSTRIDTQVCAFRIENVNHKHSHWGRTLGPFFYRPESPFQCSERNALRNLLSTFVVSPSYFSLSSSSRYARRIFSIKSSKRGSHPAQRGISIRDFPENKRSSPRRRTSRLCSREFIRPERLFPWIP